MNKTINISLIGGQPMPVHMGLADRSYDIKLFIHSNKTEVDAKEINASGGYHAGLDNLDPVNYAATLLKAKALYKCYKDDEVFVNITSGTKPWSIGFVTEALPYSNVHPFYVDQNNVYYDIKTGEKHVIECNYGIEKMLKLQKEYAEQKTLFSDYTTEDNETLKQIKKAREINIDTFNQLSIFNLNGSVEKTNFPIKYKDGSFVDYDKKTNIIRLFIRTHSGKYSNNFIFSSPHSKDLFFTSGWFEYEVASALNKIPSIDEIWLNVIFKNVNNNAKNEIDIICKVGNRLLFVECKVQIKNNIDIDKFASAVDNYGGLSAMGLFVVRDKLTRESEEKCLDNDILSFSMKGNPNSSNVVNELRQLIENNVNQINKR